MPGTGSDAQVASGIAQIAGAAGTIQSLAITGSSTVDLQAGGSLSTTNGLSIGVNGDSGTLLLSGSSAVSGPIAISGGTIWSPVSQTLSNDITVAAYSPGGTIKAEAGTVLTLTGSLSGNMLNMTGGGMIVLTGSANAITIDSGTSFQVGNGGTSGYLGGPYSIVENHGTLIYNHNDNVVLSTSVYGGTLVQAGTGTLSITSPIAANYAVISSGTLALVGAGSFQGRNSSVTDNGIFDVSGISDSSASIGSLSGNGTVVLGKKTLTLQGDGGVFSGTISGDSSGAGTGGGVTISVTGTQVFSGPNTYSGGTTIRSGTLKITGAGTLGGNADIPHDGIIPSGLLTMSNSTLDLGGTRQNIGGAEVGAFGVIQNGTLWSVSGIIIDDGSTVSANLAGTGAIFTLSHGEPPVTLSGANTNTGGTYIGGPTKISGAGTLGAASGSLRVTSWLDLGGTTQIQNGGVTVFGNNTVVQNGTLSSSGTFTLQYAYMFASLAGSGQVLVGGEGLSFMHGMVYPVTLFSAVNTYTGATAIEGADAVLSLIDAGSIAKSSRVIATQGGTFDIQGIDGTGTSIVSLSGDGLVRIGSKTLTLSNAGDAFSGVISGTGGLTLRGGNETLSGVNSYTGNTAILGGTLAVTGSIASASVNVGSGGTLAGTGKVGATSIASGGTLNPGSTTTPGTLSVTGNLTLASGANYLDVITPTAAGLTSVSGSANVGGTVTTNFTGGAYPRAQRYTILSAAGGISGTFANLNGVPGYLKAQLSYDANNVYLSLIPTSLAPLLTNSSGNQHNIATAIDAVVTTGAAVPSAGFIALYNLSGPALNNAIDQVSGQAAPNVTNAVGQSFLSFMSMASGGASDNGYGGADMPHRAQLGAGEMRVWGAAYGGHVGLSGDSASGAAGLSSNNVGMIGGADMQIDDMFTAGVTMGLGRQLFHSGNGSGDSNDYLIGLYGRARAGDAYVAASLGYGWHQIKALRVVTVSGTDVLQGKQNAHDIGGRIETGWRVAMDEDTSVIPYGAFAGESFESPAYAETAVSGASTFALAYAPQTTGLGRSELGARLDRDYILDQGTLTADLRAAWAHQLDDQPFVQASFQNLPGATFQVAGVRPGRDTALLGLDLEMRSTSGLFFGVKGEGQFGAGTTVVEGLGNLGWRW